MRAMSPGCEIVVIGGLQLGFVDITNIDVVLEVVKVRRDQVPLCWR